MGLCEVSSWSWWAAAEGRHGIHQRERNRPPCGSGSRATAHTARVLHSSDEWNSGVSAESWSSGGNCEQGHGRTSSHRGPYQKRASGPGREYGEYGVVTCRFIIDSSGSTEQRAGILYDDTRRKSGGHGD